MNDLITTENTWITKKGKSVFLPDLVQRWLAERSQHTKDAYLDDMKIFVNFVGTLQFDEIEREELAQFAVTLEGSDNTRKRRIATVKSFFTFIYKEGLIPENIGSSMRSPKVLEKLSEKIIDESSLLLLLAMEKNLRNHCLLRVLYSSGMRVSELCDLTWGMLEKRPEGGQINIVGKGKKERSILLSKGTWEELLRFKPAEAQTQDYVFQSRITQWKGKDKGRRLSREAVIQIVRNAAKRAEIARAEKVSPHFFRHSHASHAIDNGAPITVVRDTLGHSNIATTNKYAHIHPSDSSSLTLKV